MKTLQNLARKGRTIIVTIHQPRSEIWGLFDNIILLTRGKPAYAGSADECLPYFENLGHKMPPFTNPAEHVIDIVSVDNRSEEAEATAQLRVNRLTEAWREHASTMQTEKISGEQASTVQKSTKGSRARDISLLQQIRVLTARTWVVTLRDPMGMFGSLVEAITMAVIIGWIFLQLDGSLSGIRSRQGALYIASAMQGYLILLYETYRLTIDIHVFDEEARQGVVGIPAFLISRRLARLLIEDIPVPLIFSIIFYFMAGFRKDGEVFLTFFSVILLEQYIAVCFATVCVAVSRNFAGVSARTFEMPGWLTSDRQAWSRISRTRCNRWRAATSSSQTRYQSTSDGQNGPPTCFTLSARWLQTSSQVNSTTVRLKAVPRIPHV